MHTPKALPVLPFVLILLCHTHPMAANMYDGIFEWMAPPTSCENGCAAWASLSEDGCIRKQSDVDAKWALGRAPSDAMRSCAAPSHDPGVYGAWCYCKGSGSAAWGYCTSPAGGLPEQVNLQAGMENSVVAAFVTFEDVRNMDGSRPNGAVATVKIGTTNPPTKVVTGVTHYYTEPGTLQRNYSMHFVPLKDLAPRTVYYYQVSGTGDENKSRWSPIMSFKSLYGASDGHPTKFAIFGDMGVYSYTNMGNLIEDVAEQRIDAVVHMGDHGYDLTVGDGTRGDGYLNAFQPVISRVPWVPVLGNHEYYDGDLFYRFLNQTYGVVLGGDGDSVEHRDGGGALHHHLSIGSFLSAGISSGSGTSRFYSVDIGLVHVIALDMNAYYFATEEAFIQPQLRWLEHDLQKAAANRERVPWIIMTAHHPLYCTSITMAAGVHQDGTDDEDKLSSFRGCVGTGEPTVEQARADMEPLMMKYGVDLSFYGHEHNYETTWPVANGTIVGDKSYVNPKAPIHIVTGAGGAPGLDTFGSAGPWTRNQLSAWGYGRVTIYNRSTFVYEHILNADSSVYDTVVVHQDSHGSFH